MMQADSDCIAAKNNNMVSRSLAVVLDAVDTNPTNDTLIAGDRQKYEKASVTDAVTVSVSDCNGIVPLLTLPGTNNALPPSDGKAIFDDFVWGNKDCYWDPHLKESVENLKYIGCLHPSTLLVGGRDIYIDTIKNAWARRVLRPPVGFTLQQIGEMGELVMRAVAQSRFTPLPEALCVAVAELCQARPPVAVTMAAISDSVRRRHGDVTAPAECVVYAMLGHLVREGKLYCTGESYGVVTPEMYARRLPQRHLAAAVVAPADTRSISCQTEAAGRKSVGRSRSLREAWGRGGDKWAAFSRSESLRCRDGLTAPRRHPAKDINLTTSSAHKDKDKGAKSSLLHKLFGRSSKKHVKTSSTAVTHVTFSAQFPPPDWPPGERSAYCAVGAPPGERSAYCAVGAPPGQRSAYCAPAGPLRRSASASSSLHLADLGPCPLQRHVVGTLGDGAGAEENVYQSIDVSGLSVRPRSQSMRCARRRRRCGTADVSADHVATVTVAPLNNAKQENVAAAAGASASRAGSAPGPATSTPLARRSTEMHDSGFHSPHGQQAAPPGRTSRSSSGLTVLASHVAVEKERPTCDGGGGRHGEASAIGGAEREADGTYGGGRTRGDTETTPRRRRHRAKKHADGDAYAGHQMAPVYEQFASRIGASPADVHNDWTRHHRRHGVTKAVTPAAHVAPADHSRAGGRGAREAGRMDARRTDDYKVVGIV